MSKVVELADDTYARLDELARKSGFDNISQLIESWAREVELQHREELIRRIDERREEMFAKYGKMEDSVPSIREDRER